MQENSSRIADSNGKSIVNGNCNGDRMINMIRRNGYVTATVILIAWVVAKAMATVIYLYLQ